MPSGKCNHLYIICSDPVFYPRQGSECLIAVNISSVPEDTKALKSPYEPTCILNIGDHPFIKHPSFVAYRQADVFGVTNIQNEVKDGICIVYPPFEDDPFNKVINGFFTTDSLYQKVKNFLNYIKLSTQKTETETETENHTAGTTKK